MNKKWKKLILDSCHEIKILVDFSWPSLLNFALCTSSCSSSVRDCSNFSYNKPNLLSALVEIGCYTKQIGFLKRERCDLNSKLPWNVAARHSISRRVRRQDLFHLKTTEICAANGLRTSGAVEMAFLTWISALDCSQGKEKDEQFRCHLEVKPNNARKAAKQRPRSQMNK